MNRLHQKKDLQKWRVRLIKCCIQTPVKRNMNTVFSNLWDMMSRPNLRTHRIEQGDERNTKDILNLVNEIIAENFPKP